MDDLIRRQEAIDYIDRAITAWSEDKEIAIDCLRNLPSVQPELATDCISRRAAIEAIADYLSYSTYTSSTSYLSTGALILSNVPSVQPEENTIEMQESDIDETMKRLRDARVTILPSAEPEIIYCKDCRKHNVKVGFDENFHIVWKEDACPLVDWRGKAQGHEFDYQHCSYGERREEDG